MKKCKFWGLLTKSKIWELERERQKSQRLKLPSIYEKTCHKKMFINSETFTTVRGEIPKWADLFINI